MGRQKDSGSVPKSKFKLRDSQKSMLIVSIPGRKNFEPRKWNTTNYDGLAEIRIQSDRIWTPGIIFYNARDGQFNQKYKVRVSVFASGDVSWMPPV